ncbi:MAG: hydrogenase expression/formation protein HypE, partial [Candidatus Hermodarchaeia archaeon]
IVSADNADLILEKMKDHKYGLGACQIGMVIEDPPGRVLMRTKIGGTRVVDTLSGEMLPRIC